jgi:cold shock CspA family protein/ribosome-associated translation inhibitor RaiA
MTNNIHIVFRGIPRSDAMEADVLEKFERLQRVYPRMIGCRVAIEAPHRHQHRGKHYRVRIDVTLPGNELVVGREPAEAVTHADAYVAIRDAFRAARRRVQDYVRQHGWKKGGALKQHAGPEHGRIVRLFLAEGYGFLATSDGAEVYFDRRSVLRNGFSKLQVGDEVRFAEELGEDGPQATSLTPVGREGRHAVTKLSASL